MKILATPSLTLPSICKFTLEQPFYKGMPFTVTGQEKAQASDFLKAIFALDDIKEVMVNKTYLTVSTNSLQPDWKILGKKIGEIIRLYLTDTHLSDESLFPKSLTSPPISSLDSSDDRAPEFKAIEKLIDEVINPSVASHGGRISLTDYREGKVFLKMEGGCQGCGQAQATLRQGVEKAIREKFPQIKEVIDTTDHESGHNPYY